MIDLSRGRSGRWLLMALALALLIALAIIVAPNSASGGEVPGGISVPADEGVILLSSGPGSADLWIRYYESSGSGFDVTAPTAVQTFDLSRCNVDGLPGDQLLTITGSGGNGDVALLSNGLGVKDKGNCSTDQGRVNDGQTLTIELGSYFTNPNLVIDAAEIDVEGKHSTDLAYSTDTGPSGVIPLSNSSDNGPDSGAGDNEVAEIGDGTGFRSLTLAPDGSSLAAVAIEGGGDGPVSGGFYRTELGIDHGTLFHLVSTTTYDGTLDCNEAVAKDGVDGDAADRVTVTRQSNKGDCTDDLIEYTIVIDDTGVVFDPNIGDREDTNFLVQIDWAPYADPFTPPHRTISLDGVTYEPVEACSSQDSEGSVILLDPDPDDIFLHPTEVPWCLAGQQQVLLDDGTWQQIQWYDGGIDPRWI